MSRNSTLATAGMKLAYGAVATPPVYTPFPGVRMFPKLPEVNTDEYEISDVDQLNGDGSVDWTKYFALSQVDPGTLQFVMGVDEANVALLYGMLRTPQCWKVSFSSGAMLTFIGGIKTIAPEGVAGKDVLFTITIRLSGPVLFTPASALITISGVATSGAKTVTITFSGSVVARTFIPANFTITHGGVAVPADTLVQGGGGTTVIATATGWQASPTGDTWNLIDAPGGVKAPANGVCG